MSATVLLSRFTATRPRHEVPQERALHWLAEAHARAEAKRNRLDDRDRARFEVKTARVIRRVACSPEKIARRGQSVADLAEFYLDGTRARSEIFRRIVDEYFEEEYSAEPEPPDDLIHVTCTGYVAPSGAQKLVARRGWGAATRVTNAYHMGCYASIPAMRMAAGFVATGARRVDLVHTELCSLHFDPANHTLEQLVVQSLFGDGFIRYRMAADDRSSGLRVLAMQEHVLADSADAMSWIAGDHGMQMTLARDVPDRVAKAVRGFVVALFARAGLGVEHARNAVFAVHPGGPKIIDQVARMLELDEAQVAESRSVLSDHGNMSSATLPHIWMRVLADPRVPAGTLVPSLAFGPGLTVCGALLEKR